MGNVGVISAVVHDVLKTDQFESLSDLAEAVKTRCARLKIPYHAGVVTEAIHLVERTRPVVCDLKSHNTNRSHIERIEQDVRPITREEAAELWPRLMAALLREQHRRRA
jgi:hypothetical protein